MQSENLLFPLYNFVSLVKIVLMLKLYVFTFIKLVLFECLIIVHNLSHYFAYGGRHQPLAVSVSRNSAYFDSPFNVYSFFHTVGFTGD